MENSAQARTHNSGPEEVVWIGMQVI